MAEQIGGGNGCSAALHTHTSPPRSAERMNRKEKRKAQRAELGKASDLLIQEMNEGKWDHIPNLHSTPTEEIKELNEELERRCPGYEKEKYGEAIARSIWYNR